MTPGLDQPSTLNDPQHQAVTHVGEPLLVLAGPGTGKTRVIVERIAHLIRERRFAPQSVLACTYTVAAARQLRERLAPLVGALAADSVRAHTLHGFGHTLLRRHAARLGLPPRPRLIDPVRRRLMIESVCAEQNLFPWALGPAGRSSAAHEAEQIIAALADAGVTPQDALRWLDAQQPNTDPVHDPETLAHACRLAIDLEARRRAEGLIDFADLIQLPLRLLRTHDPTRSLLRADLRAIVVDEFQDCNTAQIALLREIAGPATDLCVVGDDDQAIYAFRGADEHAFQRFANLWPHHRIVTLDINYRGSPAIVRAANAVIAGASRRFRPDKRLRSASNAIPDPAHVRCVALPEEADEPWILAQLLLDARQSAGPGFSWDNTAVIARTHNDLDKAAPILNLAGIPWKRAREGGLAGEPGVQDALAWTRWVCDPGASVHARRILARPPHSLPREDVSRWESAFRERRSRHALDPDHHDNPGNFTRFLELCAQRESDPTLAAKLRRALSLRDALADACAAEDAHAALTRIVRDAELIHAELLPPRARARRVRALLALIAFVRDRLPSFDPPHDLRAWTLYLDKLHEIDPELKSLGGERALGDDRDQLPLVTSDDGLSPAGHVHLLTAHAAKGLEFDDVYVLRVKPQHGFPQTSKGQGDDRWTPPPSLTGEPGDDRGDREKLLDEERRLFYVACTRARHQLSLFSKRSQKPSKSTVNFFEELAGKHAARLCQILDGNAILGRARESGLTLRRPTLDTKPGAEDGASPHAHALAALRERAWELATDTLAHAGERDEHQTQQRAAADARTLRFLDHACRGKLNPTQAAALAHAETDPHAQRLMRLAAAELASDPPPQESDPEANNPLMAPPRAPLQLSYSAVHMHEQCPACWYARFVLDFQEPEDRNLRVGAIAHACFEWFAKSHQIADTDGTPKPSLADLEAYAKAQLLRTPLAQGDDPQAALRDLVSLARAFHASFTREDPHVLEVEMAVTFPFLAAGTTHSFTAKIDRVDLAQDGSFRITDYKTGGATKAHQNPQPDDLQLVIYAMALAHANRLNDTSELRGSARYWNPAADTATLDFAAMNFDNVRHRIQKAAAGMLSGRYPAKPGCRRGLCTILLPPRARG